MSELEGSTLYIPKRNNFGHMQAQEVGALLSKEAERSLSQFNFHKQDELCP